MFLQDEGLSNPDVVTKYKSAAKIVNSTFQIYDFQLQCRYRFAKLSDD